MEPASWRSGRDFAGESGHQQLSSFSSQTCELKSHSWFVGFDRSSYGVMFDTDIQLIYSTLISFWLIFDISSSTKASLLAAFIFVVDKKTDLISAPHALVYFGVVIFFVYFKLSSLLLGITDPFIPFENLFCAVCMGGVFDVIQETFYGKPKTAEENGDAVKPKAGEISVDTLDWGLNVSLQNKNDREVDSEEVLKPAQKDNQL